MMTNHRLSTALKHLVCQPLAEEAPEAIVYLNGEFLPESKAVVSVNDHSFKVQ